LWSAYQPKLGRICRTESICYDAEQEEFMGLSPASVAVGPIGFKWLPARSQGGDFLAQPVTGFRRRRGRRRRGSARYGWRWSARCRSDELGGRGGPPKSVAGRPADVGAEDDRGGVGVIGGWGVGLRPVSKSGPPTIDVDIPGIPIKKIKFV
jgi:hypothetical protein